MLRLSCNWSRPTCHLIVGPLLHKTLEAGGGRTSWRSRGLDCNFRFNTRGDHMGLKCSLEAWGLLLELNLTDGRHWNWNADRFYLPGEEDVTDQET